MTGHPVHGDVLVVVVGNEHAGDDAFGPLVGRELLRRRVPGVEVLNVGMNPSRLTDALHGRDAVIVVDAVAAADTPEGRLIDCPWAAAAAEACHGVAISSHGLSVLQQMELAAKVGLLPREARFVGVTVRPSVAVGQRPARRLPRFVHAAADRIEELARLQLQHHWERCHA